MNAPFLNRDAGTVSIASELAAPAWLQSPLRRRASFATCLWKIRMMNGITKWRYLGR